MSENLEDHRTPEECTRLLASTVGAGNTDMVEMLLNGGADIHDGGDQALCVAVHIGDTKMAKLLLKRGADVHTCEDEPLCIAVQNRDRKMIDVLLKAGANMDVMLQEHRGELDLKALNLVEEFFSAGARKTAARTLDAIRSAPRVKPKWLKP